MIQKKKVVIGLLGTTKDMRGKGNKRWDRWRPTVSLFQQQDIKFDRLELLHGKRYQGLARKVASDVQSVSEHSEINLYDMEMPNPWDFEEVYAALLEFCLNYTFKPDTEEYYLNITTGTHVAQICWFLLCETNYMPAKLIQSSPRAEGENSSPIGDYTIIDLDLSKYDKLASRFAAQFDDDVSLLKKGIQTANPSFNAMIEQIEKVAGKSKSPMLITGPTGAGKTQLAKQVYRLKKQKSLVTGEFVAINCATLKGDNAMSVLFGHQKGAYTGAVSQRDGVLKKADQGLLFLDEIAELGLDEQAMLLHAIEQKSFYPLGSDQPVSSDFQLITGTNKDLYHCISVGEFREDLLARINLWTYKLPGLSERKEDLPANVEFELQRFEKQTNSKVGFNLDAKKQYLNFAQSDNALWSANFRDLTASVERMVTLAEGGRINSNNVEQEITRLQHHWQGNEPSKSITIDLSLYFNEQQLNEIDQFDQMQLANVIEVCKSSKSIADAGRKLFDFSRTQKQSTNDGHRLRLYLKKFGLNFSEL